ncbi:hypothetical protein BDZ89DRAFT_1065617 [Hymenopellis radicata]|nr:hypothetical protein BDZ89DRAFT_1065617 [Hymenopellis radicata]
MALSVFFSLFALVNIAIAAEPPSNLPHATPGVFTAQGSSIVDADIDDVWRVLTNFSSYPDWNPFVRSQVVTNEFYIPLDDQTPQENLGLIINTQIPPLPAPVNASTPANLLNAHTTFERIHHLDLENYRIAWGLAGVPDSIIGGDRWSALSSFVDDDGKTKTFYESREIYIGFLASTLNEAFGAQAEALKVIFDK